MLKNIISICFSICLIISINIPSGNAALLKGYTNCEWGSPDCNPCVQDVAAAVNSLRKNGDILGFHINNHTTFPISEFHYHWQGVQRIMSHENQYLVITRSHPQTAAFAVVGMYSRGKNPERFRSNRLGFWGVDITIPEYSDGIVRYEPVDTDYEHAGGIQTIGKWMAIPMEASHSGADTRIVFYDLSNPLSPQKKSYVLPLNHSQAGTASIGRLIDGRYILVHGTSDAASLRFYVSTETDLEAVDPDFQPKYTWSSESGAYVPNWGSYQNMNIINQCNGDMYLMGFRNTNAAGLGEDWIELYRMDIDEQSYAVSLTQVARRHLYCSWNQLTGDIPQQCNLVAAAGSYIDLEGRLIVYSTEHYNDGPADTVKFMEFRSQYNPTSCNTIHDAWIELYKDSAWQGRSLMIDYLDIDKEVYSDFELVEEFGDQTSSVRYCIPDGHRYVLFQHNNFGGQSSPFQGGGYGEADNMGDSASSGRFECRIDGQWYVQPHPYILVMEGAVSGTKYGGGDCSPYLVVDDAYVPASETLDISAGVSPHALVLFRHSSRITANGTFRLDGTDGPVKLMSKDNTSRGIKIYKQMVLRNGGQIKVP